MKIKTFFAALLLSVTFFSGCGAFYSGDCELVEEEYIVKPGDTIWGISKEFMEKNTGTNRYILEFKEGIYENNPWLTERKGIIYPGDKLVITYWVKKEAE